MPPPSPTDGDAPSKWRLDAVDLRAGLAFASWRPDVSARRPAGQAPMLHVGPPFFTPTPVSNLALALGATRGAFRPGLFIDGAEAAFDTPDDVAEFVRRAYVAGAAGDGSDGDGGEPGPPPPLPEPPDLPNLPDLPDLSDLPEPSDLPAPRRNVEQGPEGRAAKAAEALAADAAAFRGQVAQAQNGSVGAASWTAAAQADAVVSLRNGAANVFRELLARRPLNVLAAPAAFLRWQDSFRAWCRFVGATGLWPFLQAPLEPLVKHWIQHSRLAQFERWPPRVIQGVALRSILTGEEDEDWIRHWYRTADFFDFEFWPNLGMEAGSSGAGDPLADLRALPLPGDRWGLVCEELRGRASLYHLMCATTAAPQLATDTQAFELLLFACAGLVASGSPVEDGHPVHGRFTNQTPAANALQLERVRKIGHEATSWLAEHLPRRAFAAGYEAAIIATRDSRYRDLIEPRPAR